MSGKLEVSFNSPQCGWMSIGFSDGDREFHTTTAHAPHETALSELLTILTAMLSGMTGEHVLRWSRDPEEFDLRFTPAGSVLHIEIYEYPTRDRDLGERQLVFSHTGTMADVCAAFAATFDQLYADRDTDEFEANWRQPFPTKEYAEFRSALERG